MKKPIYMDNNATTPLDPRAFEAMKPFFTEHFGNAMSAQHSFGWTAKSAVEKAREQCAALIGAEPREVIFTSGATESIHLAILGLLEALGEPRHLITTSVEHKCVLEVAVRATKLGHSLTLLPVNRHGQVELEKLRAAIRPETALVSVVHGNNEIGTINPVGEIGALCAEKGVALHVDAAQTLGKVPIDVRAMKIDLLSTSAHKIYGPKGAGFLYARQTQPRVRLAPYLVGGGQEKGQRGGTHNVPAIVGFGAACEIARNEMATEAPKLSEWRDRIVREVRKSIPDAELNGHPTERLPNSVSLTFGGVLPDQLLLAMPNLAYSSASACSSGDGGLSHVLSAIGRKDRPDAVTVRLGLGRFNSEDDIEEAIETLVLAVAKARMVSRTY